jgi:1-deoxy-D-xylulose-5-phosphate reductoisomerase
MNSSLPDPMRVAVLGVTGSIGRSTLDVLRRHPQRYRLVGVSAHRRSPELFDICREFHPLVAVTAGPEEAAALAERLAAGGERTEVAHGRSALERLASHAQVDAVMAAIVGAAGLASTLAAVRAGKRVLLANKEALVLAGSLFMEAVKAHGACLLPIDSEHNAVFQCMPAAPQAGVALGRGIRRILLTGSGGPFRTLAREALRGVTPERACAHPTWKMGPKISVDSATMVNKALEIIEAHWLFSAPAERIEVVIHPQSVIHSMVEYDDGSVLAQLGQPDMRTPIAQALAFPERIEAGVPSLDLPAIASLTFERPDFERFPALRIAYEVLRSGGSAAAVFSAANEIAVEAFLAGQLPFAEIESVIEETLQRMPLERITDLEHLLGLDERARAGAWATVAARARA